MRKLSQSYGTRVARLLFATWLCIGLLSCGGGGGDNAPTQSGTGPASCTPTLSGATPPTSAGGTFSLQLDIAAGCAWQASTDQSWVTSLTPASGTGASKITYTVQASTEPPRSALIKVGSASASITQANGCTYTVPPQLSVSYMSTNAGMSLSTNTSCPWTASADSSWIHITQASGVGPTSIGANIDENGGDTRTAKISVGSSSINVTQGPSDTAVVGERSAPETILASGDLTLHHYQTLLGSGLNYTSYATDGRTFTGTLDANGDFLAYAGGTVRFFVGATYVGESSADNPSLGSLANFSTEVCPEQPVLNVASNIAFRNQAAGCLTQSLATGVGRVVALNAHNTSATTATSGIAAAQNAKDFASETAKMMAVLAFKLPETMLALPMPATGFGDCATAADGCTYRKNGTLQPLTYSVETSVPPLIGGHPGFDIVPKVTTNVSVYAIADGKVLSLDKRWGAVFVATSAVVKGTTLRFVLTYIHLDPDTITVQANNTIHKGDRLGTMAGTGRLNGATIKNLFANHLHVELGSQDDEAGFESCSSPLTSCLHIFQNTSGATYDLKHKPLSNSVEVLRYLIDPSYSPPQPSVTVTSIQFPTTPLKGLDSLFKVGYSSQPSANQEYKFVFSMTGSTLDTECAYDHAVQAGYCNFPSVGSFTVKAVSLTSALTTPFPVTVQDNLLASFSATASPLCIAVHNTGIDTTLGTSAVAFNRVQPAALIKTNMPGFATRFNFTYSLATLQTQQAFLVLLKPGDNYLEISSYRPELGRSQFANFRLTADQNYCSGAQAVSPSPITIVGGSNDCPSGVWIEAEGLASGDYYFYRNLIPAYMGHKGGSGFPFIKGDFAFQSNTELYIVGLSDILGDVSAIGFSKFAPTCR